MGIRAAKAGIGPGSMGPSINPAFLHMYMPLLDGRFPYNISPVELAALAMANNFPNVLMGATGAHNNLSNQNNGTSAPGSSSSGDGYPGVGDRGNRLSGRSSSSNSSSPGSNSHHQHHPHNNNNHKSGVRSSASSSSPSPSSSTAGHLAQTQALNLRRSFPSPVPAGSQGEDLRRKNESPVGKKSAVVRSEDAPLNLSKPRGSSGSQSRASPLVQCPPSPVGQRQSPHPQQQGMQHHQQQNAHHHPAHQSPTGLRNPLLSPSSSSSKFPPVGLSGWQPSPLFAPGFYSNPPFIPYNRSMHQNGADGQEKQPAFPFRMFPSGLEGMPMPGFPTTAHSHHNSHNNHNNSTSHNNGSKKESSGGSAGSAGGFSDSSNLDAEKKEDTVVTCQSEFACLFSVCACSPFPAVFDS